MEKKNPDRQKVRTILLWFLMAAIIAFMYTMNAMTPLFADDFSYSVSFVTKEPFTSFSEVLASQYLHYFTTNGRTVVHVLAQVLLWIGKPALNLFNALAFAGLCYMICYHAAGSVSEIRPWQLIAGFTALWFLTPHFGGSYLWVMGAANYLYSPLLLLIYLVRYRRLFRIGCPDTDKGSSLAGNVGWMLVSVAAGWTNENTSLALICMILAVVALRLLCRQKVWNWIWAGLAGSILGSMLLFLSPAQGKRLSAAGGFGGLSQWAERFVSITKFALTHFYWLAVLFLLAGILYWLRTKDDPFLLRISRLRATGIYCVGALVSMYSMVGSPEFPVWVWSSILVFILICVLSLVVLLREKETEAMRLLQAGICITAVLCVACSFLRVRPELMRIREEYDHRESLIVQAAQAGTGLIVTPIRTDCTYSSYSLFQELNQDPNTWPNNAIANYYGISSICTESQQP